MLTPTFRISRLLALGSLAAFFAFASTASVRAQSCEGVESLGVLPGFPESYAQGISADGDTIVGSSIFGVAANAAAFRWTASSGLTPLGTLGGLDSDAWSCSADGSVIVGESVDTSGRRRPFRWTQATGMQDIFGFATIPDSGAARDVSADGQVVVGTLFRGTEVKGFTWTMAIGVTEFTAFGSRTEVHAVSADGNVLVGQSVTPQGRRAFRWTQSQGAQDLGTLGGNFAEAYGISADGNTIFGWSSPPTGPKQAFRWTQPQGMQPIDINIMGDAIALDGSADGKTIVGRTTSGGLIFAFLWNANTGTQILEPFGAGFGVAQAVSDDGSILAGSTSFQGAPLIAARLALSPLGTTYCVAPADNSTGCPGRLSATGSLTTANQNLTLTAKQLPAQSFGFFLTARTPGFWAMPGGSQGNLCVFGSLGRLNGPGQIQNTGGGDTFSLALDLGNLPTATGPVAVLAGQTWYFQAWYRDQNPGPASNFTDALSLTLE